MQLQSLVGAWFLRFMWSARGSSTQTFYWWFPTSGLSRGSTRAWALPQTNQLPADPCWPVLLFNLQPGVPRSSCCHWAITLSLICIFNPPIAPPLVLKIVRTCWSIFKCSSFLQLHGLISFFQLQHHKKCHLVHSFRTYMTFPEQESVCGYRSVCMREKEGKKQSLTLDAVMFLFYLCLSSHLANYLSS